MKALWSPEISQAVAALFGFEVAIRFRYCLVHLEGDSMNVVRAIDKRVFGFSPIHLLYDCIFSHVSSSLDGFCCSFDARNGNSLAHSIVRWDTGLPNENIYMNPFPQELLAWAFRDQ